MRLYFRLSFALLLATATPALLQDSHAGSESSRPGRVASIEMNAELEEKCRDYLRKFEPATASLPGLKIRALRILEENWQCEYCAKEVNGMPAEWPQKAVHCDNCSAAPVGVTDPPMVPKKIAAPKKSETSIYGQVDQKKVAAGAVEGMGNPLEAVRGEMALSSAQIDAALQVTPVSATTAGGTTIEGQIGGKDWNCLQCGSAGNRSQQTHCRNCGRSRVEAVEEQRVAAQESRRETDRLRKRISEADSNDFARVSFRKKGAIIGAGMILGIGFFSHITLQDTPIEGTVERARWVQTVRAEQFQPVTKKLKKGEYTDSQPVMPVNGQGEKQGARTIRCDADSCDVEVYEWKEVDSKEIRGEYAQPMPSMDHANSNWAHLEMPQDGRIQTYTRFDMDLLLSSNGEAIVAKWRTNDPAEFLKFAPRSRITAQIDGLQKIKAVTLQKKGGDQ